MAEETKPAETTETSTTSSQETQTATATSAAEKTPASSSAPSAEATPTETVLELPENVVRNEDGTFDWRTDPTDPETTLYRGTLKELFENASKGMTEKDRLIREFKAKSLKVPETFKGGKPAEADEIQIELPPFEEVFDKHLERARVDKERLGWTRTDWKAYQEKEALADWEIAEEIRELREGERDARQSAHAEHDALALDYVNAGIIDEETEQVQRLLAQYKVDAGNLDYEALLSRVYNDPQNRTKLGKLKSGVIVRESEAEIRKLVSGRDKTALQRKLEDDARKAKEALKTVTPSATTTAAPKKPSGQTARNLDEALKAAVAEYAK